MQDRLFDIYQRTRVVSETNRSPGERIEIQFPRSVPPFTPVQGFSIFPRFPGFIKIFLKKEYISVFHGRRFHALSLTYNLLLLSTLGSFVVLYDSCYRFM